MREACEGHIDAPDASDASSFAEAQARSAFSEELSADIASKKGFLDSIVQNMSRTEKAANKILTRIEKLASDIHSKEFAAQEGSSNARRAKLLSAELASLKQAQDHATSQFESKRQALHDLQKRHTELSKEVHIIEKELAVLMAPSNAPPAASETKPNPTSDPYTRGGSIAREIHQAVLNEVSNASLTAMRKPATGDVSKPAAGLPPRAPVMQVSRQNQKHLEKPMQPPPVVAAQSEMAMEAPPRPDNRWNQELMNTVTQLKASVDSRAVQNTEEVPVMTEANQSTGAVNNSALPDVPADFRVRIGQELLEKTETSPQVAVVAPTVEARAGSRVDPRDEEILELRRANMRLEQTKQHLSEELENSQNHMQQLAQTIDDQSHVMSTQETSIREKFQSQVDALQRENEDVRESFRLEKENLDENVKVAEDLALEYKAELDKAHAKASQLESGVDQALETVDARYIEILKEKQTAVDDLTQAVTNERDSKDKVIAELEQLRGQMREEVESDKGNNLWRDRARGLAEQMTAMQIEIDSLRASEKARLKSMEDDQVQHNQAMIESLESLVQALKTQVAEQEKLMTEKKVEYQCLVNEAAKKGRVAQEGLAAHVAEIQALRAELGGAKEKVINPFGSVGGVETGTCSPVA